MLNVPPVSNSHSATLLSGRNLRCERDDRLLFDGLSFDLSEGQVVQLRGRNGSGKTTLLRAICGLHGNYDGDILWRGKRIGEIREDVSAELIYLGHKPGVSALLSPRENLQWFCGLRRSVTEDQILVALRQVGLGGFEHSPCYSLSAGQKQRVAIARLLLGDAKVWVLDEPFTTLDAQAVSALETLLKQHASAGGAVIVTTHHELKLLNLKEISL